MTGSPLELRADCARCFALCCVAPGFAASADFAIDKPAGRPCPNLQDDHRCAIHDRLRIRGFPGCSAYDCFGAGQHVAQVIFGGRDWREHPDTAADMFAVFGVLRQLHELLWYLSQALEMRADDAVRRALDDTDRLARGRPDALLRLDVAEHRKRANAVLSHTSELVRRDVRPDGVDHRGADLIGARLAGSDLRAANLRGALLIGADLRGADLTMADVTGADLRGAELAAADLTSALFLTQAQLESARGDSSTTVSPPLHHPRHW